jgi:hypothetical protein
LTLGDNAYHGVSSLRSEPKATIAIGRTFLSIFLLFASTTSKDYPVCIPLGRRWDRPSGIFKELIDFLLCFLERANESCLWRWLSNSNGFH